MDFGFWAVFCIFFGSLVEGFVEGLEGFWRFVGGLKFLMRGRGWLLKVVVGLGGGLAYFDLG